MTDAEQATPEPAPAAATRAADPPEAAAGVKFAEIQRQRDEYLDQLQRAHAEFANFQKRARTQAEIDRQYAISALASDLLNVVDDLERAIEAARGAGQATIVDGLELVRKKFLDALAKHGVEPIAALDQPFDPNLHEALTQLPDAAKPDHTIVAELSRGYRLRDRVLRPSRVAVSIKP